MVPGRILPQLLSSAYASRMCHNRYCYHGICGNRSVLATEVCWRVQTRPPPKVQTCLSGFARGLPATFGCRGISRCSCTLAGREEMGAG
jgi:hypothetical protein